jgi:hypothetical protein
MSEHILYYSHGVLDAAAAVFGHGTSSELKSLEYIHVARVVDNHIFRDVEEL